jgi:hypothetical protein
MFADHLGGRAKLLVPGQTKRARPASREIVNTNAVARFEIRDRYAGFLNHARDFVTQSERQSRDRRNPGAIMRVGMANPGGANAEQDVIRSDTGDVDFLFLERRTNGG